jgi:hypothetical protein
MCTTHTTHNTPEGSSTFSPFFFVLGSIGRKKLQAGATKSAAHTVKCTKQCTVENEMFVKKRRQDVK